MGNCFYELLTQLLNEKIPTYTPSTWSLWIFHIFRYKKCHTSLLQPLTAPLKASKGRQETILLSHPMGGENMQETFDYRRKKNVPFRKYMNSMKYEITHPRTYFGEGNSNHYSALAWRIPWMEEPGGLQSMGSLRVRQDWAFEYSKFSRLRAEIPIKIFEKE